MGTNATTAAAFAEIALATGGEAKKFNADELLDVVCIQALEQVSSSQDYVIIHTSPLNECLLEREFLFSKKCFYSNPSSLSDMFICGWAIAKLNHILRVLHAIEIRYSRNPSQNSIR